MTDNNNRKPSWGSAEQIAELRDELRRQIIEEELERALQRESVGKLMLDLHIDAVSFRQCWLRPLLAEGVSVDAALACIARSFSQPN